MKPKKIFVAYRYRGENLDILKKTMTAVCDSLNEAGHNHFCTIFEEERFAEEKWTGKQIMKKACKEIDSSDIVLFFVKSEKISQGMLVEFGYSLAKKKKMILAIKKGIKNSIFRRHIDEVIKFENINDLKRKLSKIRN